MADRKVILTIAPTGGMADKERIKGTMAGAEMCTFDPHIQCMHSGDLELLLAANVELVERMVRILTELNLAAGQPA